MNKLTEEHKRKISESLKGRIVSLETRLKIKNSKNSKTQFKKGQLAINWNGFKKGHKTSKPFKKGFKPYPHKINCLCFRCNHKFPITAFKKGMIPWNKGKTGIFSKEILERMRRAKIGKKLSIEHRRKIGEKNRKENHWNWQGGKSRLNKIRRESFEYKLWRESVFQRDNYTCIWCGKRGKLQADHIKPYVLFPELRFAIDNGRTLCIDCHRKTDTYGLRAMYKNKNKTIGLVINEVNNV